MPDTLMQWLVITFSCSKNFDVAYSSKTVFGFPVQTIVGLFNAGQSLLSLFKLKIVAISNISISVKLSIKI